MPVPKWPRRLLERASISEVYAVRSYIGEDGQNYCDVVDPDNGFLARGCMVVGSRTKPINAPKEEWSPLNGIVANLHPQVLLLRVSPDKQPYVLDLLYNPARLQPPQDSDADTDTQMSNRDHGVDNGQGHRVVVRENGSAAVAATKFDVTLGGGAMAVSDGDLSESAALAGKVHDVLNNVINVVNDLQRWALQVDTFLAGAVGDDFFPIYGHAPRQPASLTVSLAALQSAVLKLSGRTEEAQGV